VKTVEIVPARDGGAARRTGGVLMVAALVLFVSDRPGRASARDEFSLSPGTCEQGPQFCAVATPRVWTPTEIDLVRAALDEIEARDIGKRITERARRNGFRTLRRFAQAAQLNAEHQYEVQPMVVATAHTDEPHATRTIDVTDRFFERQSVRDHFSGQPGYLLTTEVLAHELMHAVDFEKQYSGTAEFRRVARLGMTVEQQREADRVNLERDRLNAEGSYEAAWEASRSFGIITLRGRLPSVHALDNYREAFAEFGADLVLDPNALRRLEPRVVLFLERALSDAP
jgi:hypothetical protein